MSKIYDVIVLGAGPAGLAAGLYAGRSRLSVLIIEKGQDVLGRIVHAVVVDIAAEYNARMHGDIIRHTFT